MSSILKTSILAVSVGVSLNKWCLFDCSVLLPEKINEIERKLAEAVKLQSAAAQDRDKLLPLIALAHSEHELRRQSTRNKVRSVGWTWTTFRVDNIINGFT